VEKITPITEELNQLGSSLSKFPVVNPYKVPAGYFDGFPARMFNIVSESTLPAALAGLPTPYQVPGGYFDSLPDTILNKAKASSAADQPLSSEQSPADELAGLSSILSGVGKSTPYSVPANYFNELSGNIVSGVHAVDQVNEELENLSPLMMTLKPVNVFSVPAGYFEGLPDVILNRVSQATEVPAKLVKGNFSRRIIQYAAAALITGLMITAGFFIMNRNNAQPEIVSIKGLEEKAAQTSDEEILNYLATQPMPINDSLINADPEIKADAILEMLANVSDEELQQYMQLQTDTKILIN
jgi:hypothetical protein